MSQTADINAQFQRILGRPARPDEIQFLGEFIDKNELSAFEVGEIIGGTPEAQQQTFQSQRDTFRQEASQDDDRILGQAQDRVVSQFLKQGRGGSSGRIAAFAGAAQNLASQRQKESLNLMMGQFNMQSQLQQGQGQQARGRGQDIRQDRINRERQMENYRITGDMFGRQMREQGIRNLQNSMTGAGIGAVSGAAQGAMVAGPWGAVAGGLAGGASGYFGGKK